MARARLLLVVVLALALPVVAAEAQTVKAPKAGDYTSGLPQDVFLRVANRRVEIVAMSFPCRKTWARTSVNDFPLKRTSRGYRFNADATGLVSYANGKPDENGPVHISGRFARDGRSVRGHIRVKTRRCGDTGYLKWKAAR
jgi:hypothetical protein